MMPLKLLKCALCNAGCRYKYWQSTDARIRRIYTFCGVYSQAWLKIQLDSQHNVIHADAERWVSPSKSSAMSGLMYIEVCREVEAMSVKGYEVYSGLKTALGLEQSKIGEINYEKHKNAIDEAIVSYGEWLNRKK